MLCADRVGEYIKKNPILKVHSVYKRTVNLWMGNEVCALYPQELSSTPMSAVLPMNENTFLKMTNLARCFGKLTIHGGQLLIDGNVWEVGDIKSWNPIIKKQLTQKEGYRLGEAVKNFINEAEDTGDSFGRGVVAALSSQNTKEQNYAKVSIVKNALLSRVASILNSNGKTMENLGKAAAEMIGLGIGLTPSGDDFLIGMLLAFWTSKELSHNMFSLFAREIAKKTDNTNEISRQILLCACRGEFGSLFHRLISHVGTDQNISEDLRQIQRIGHSSGMDTLNGILTGLWMCGRVQNGNIDMDRSGKPNCSAVSSD